jgi:hypothetical protein
MSSKALRRLFPLIVVGILIFPIISIAQVKISHVRVVRLSYVSGTVGLHGMGEGAGQHTHPGRL